MSGAPEVRQRGLVKSPYDLAGGVFLLALAVLGFVGGFNLPTGTMSSIGSGMVPKAVAVMVGVLGAAMMMLAFVAEGERLERWHLRGPVFVLGGVIVFAMLIRGSTLDFGVGSELRGPAAARAARAAVSCAGLRRARQRGDASPGRRRLRRTLTLLRRPRPPRTACAPLLDPAMEGLQPHVDLAPKAPHCTSY